MNDRMNEWVKDATNPVACEKQMKLIIHIANIICSYQTKS